MITSLNGHNCGMDDDGSLCVQVQGVGYRVVVTDLDRTFFNERRQVGDMIAQVVCRTVAKENDIVIYGFRDVDDRRAFDKITKVKGFGPGIALKLLSVHRAGTLKTMIDAKESAALAKIPGVGKVAVAKILAEVKL